MNHTTGSDEEGKGLAGREQARRLVEEGKAMMERDLRGGLAKLRQALEADPDYPELEDEIFLREDAIEKLDNLLDYVVVLLKESKVYQACQMLKELPANYIIKDRGQMLGDLTARIERTEELIQEIGNMTKSEVDRALPMYQEAAKLVPDYPGLQDEMAVAKNSLLRFKVYHDSIDASIRALNFAKADELLRSFREDYPDDPNIGKLTATLAIKKRDAHAKRKVKRTLVTAGVLAVLILLMAFGYYGYETLVIRSAAGDLEKVNRQVRENEFVEAQAGSRKIVAELGKVRVFYQPRKVELLAKANQVLSSESVKQGAAGRVLAEGVYVPIIDQAKVKNAKALMAEAAKLGAAGDHQQAITRYEEALPMVSDLEADLAERFKGEITSAVLAERQEMVRGLIKQGLELNRGKDFKSAMARIDEASGLVDKYQLPDTGLVEGIGKAYQQIKQDNFRFLVAEGDRQLEAGRDTEALAVYERAMVFAKANNLETANAEILVRIGETDKLVRVKTLLAKGDDNFRHSHWREAIAVYTEALKLRQECKLKQDLPDDGRALANLAKARRASVLEDLRQAEIEAGKYFTAGEWKKAKTAYVELLTLADRSGYLKDPDFIAVRDAAKTRMGEVDERLLIEEKKDYLMERHRAILRKVFNLNGEVAFLDPEVVFLIEDANGMKYSITARSYERKGNEGKYTFYEAIYVFNRKSGDWGLLKKNMSSKVSSSH